VTYVITEACIGTKDQSCTDVCPVDCIHETDEMFVIDPGECIDCGYCEPSCPVSAIVPGDGVPPGQHDFVAINAAWPIGGPAEVQRRLEDHRAGSTT
jgi:NAD-dependent dihydropyrimidine dehydrogenase PreA subunit